MSSSSSYKRSVEMCGSFEELSSIIEAIPPIIAGLGIVTMIIIVLILASNAPQPPLFTENYNEIIHYYDAVQRYNSEAMAILNGILIGYPVTVLIVTITSHLYLMRKRSHIDKTHNIVLGLIDVLESAVEEKIGKELKANAKLTSIDITDLYDLIVLESALELNHSGSTINTRATVAIALWSNKVCVAIEWPEVHMKFKLFELLRSS